MRPIKFKGKRIDNGEWVCGDLQIQAMPLAFILPYDQCDGYASSVSVIPETVGQYTGLKDKNGEEIYEGDIVRVHIPRQERYIDMRVEWLHECAMFWLIEGLGPWNADGTHCFDLSEPDDNEKRWRSFEIIGNIHEGVDTWISATEPTI